MLIKIEESLIEIIRFSSSKNSKKKKIFRRKHNELNKNLFRKIINERQKLIKKKLNIKLLNFIILN